jgi:hypothetical protein
MILIYLLGLLQLGATKPAPDRFPFPVFRFPIVSTFSIVARDPANGDLGVAVQSKFPNVRVAVPYAKAGVGAVA